MELAEETKSSNFEFRSSDEERLALALRLHRSGINQRRDDLHNAAAKGHGNIPEGQFQTVRLLFEKRLSRTDVEHRLQFPTSVQQVHLPPVVEGFSHVDFRVKYGDEQKDYIFRCNIRKGIHDVYTKPAITKGWPQVAGDKDFRVGDKLSFYKVEGGDSEYFKFEVRRKMVLFGKEVWSLV
ncbi:B3 domain-containing protein [Quillaja saponaria]|uniref:B3 domain-containing protein n=1 Tax=Quillaja saponaria TaxID=32244 RepID=A0AAD7LIE6_QUISA|nr:B3 domain-containing protein [Quillaja saponaria]